jgi:Leucine-rich repeat (LRR) protein
MADDEKVILKNDLIKKYMHDFDYTLDRQSFQYKGLNLGSRRLDALNNSILDFKFIQNLDLSNNNIVDINLLQQFDGLVTLKLSKNKIKNIAIFTNEELF